MKKNRANYGIILLLVVVFAAPGLFAFLFYQHPEWVHSPQVNRGTLLTPPLAFHAFDELPPHRWRIVLWSPHDCDAACMKQLNVLARVRLALGRQLYGVDLWFLLGEQTAGLSTAAQTILAAHDVHIMQLSPEASKGLPEKEAIYLVDPYHYAILAYSHPLHPEALYQDLKHLLNTSEHRGG